MAHDRGRNGGPIRRAAAKIKHLFTRGKRAEESVEIRETATATPQRNTVEASQPRATRREADIPLDVLDSTYTPRVASSRGSFRSDGADRHRDQEFANGAADTRWNDEDRLTNKSGDPRIGTHGRTYEPGEARDEARH